MLSSSKIKVLVLISELDQGGPTLGALALSKYVPPEACQVILGVLGREESAAPALVAQARREGVRVVFFAIPGWGGLRQAGVVREFVQRENIAICHSFGIRPDLINFILRRHCLAIGSVRGTLRPEYRHRYGSLVAGLFTPLHIGALKRLHKVTALTRAMGDYLEGEGVPPAKLVHIPNFVDPAWAAEGSAPPDCPGKGSGGFEVGYVGSLIARKRVDWLIRALGDLASRFPPGKLRLHICGDGPLRSELEALAAELGVSERVVFHGFREDAAEFMRRMDLIALASDSEGQPRVLMEAMSLGKTCLSAAFPGADELIEDGVDGYLFPRDSPPALARKLEEIARGRRLLDSGIIRAKINRQFDATQGALATYELYEQMMNQARGQAPEPARPLEDTPDPPPAPREQGGQPPLVTVVVPCYNEIEYIAKCLDSILATSYPLERLEVLVVDGMSHDGTRDIIRQYQADSGGKVILVDNPKRILAAAWNLGIKNARGEVIMALNAHAIFPPGYIPTCIDYLGRYPEADYVGGVILSHSRHDNRRSKAIALALSSRFGVGPSDFRVGTSQAKWSDTAAFGGYRRSVFERVGIYNEDLVRSQDMDFHIRMKEAGCRILLVPEMASHYYLRPRLRNFFRDYFRNGFWATYPLKINPKAVYWRHLVPMVFVASLLISGLLGFFFSPFLYLFLVIAGSYALANLAFSAQMCLRERYWGYLFLLPVIYAILHFSYGLGSLAGLAGPLSALPDRLRKKPLA